MKTLLLEELSWPEVKEALENGMRTVLIFSASIEQHGPHLPEATDTIIGYRQAADLARRLGGTLVAPVIRPGLSAHHMSFPGSLTLRPEVFAGVVEDYIDCYVRHGFETIILASSHGGNFGALAAIAEAQQERYPDKTILCGYSLQDMTGWLDAEEKKLGFPLGTCGGHADCYETSLMLRFAPETVCMEKARPGFVGKVTDEVLARFNQGVQAVSEIGVMGDPTVADPELGARFFTGLQDVFEAKIREKLEDRDAHKAGRD